MQISRLPPNERAPVGSAFIEIEILNDEFRVLGFQGFGQSGVIATGLFTSPEDAENAGIAWANGRDLAHVYVVRTCT